MSGLSRRDDGTIALERDGVLRALPVASFAELLRMPLADIRSMTSGDLPTAGPSGILPPIDGRTEVWASGVTYTRSRTARMDEATDPDIYDRVYTAERPELFLKSAAWRVVTDGEPVGIREDSTWDVPEPELAVIANAFGEIVGYGICNDVSSRSIEGENALYLPQAKVYAGACALGPVIRPAWEVDATDLRIDLQIRRAGETVVDDHTSTAQLARALPDLVDWLFRAELHPDGAWLSTGTGIVPPDAFTLRTDDEIEIRIAEVGTLRSPVVRGRDSWKDRMPR